MNGVDDDDAGTFVVLKTRQPVKVCPPRKATVLPCGKTKPFTLPIVCHGVTVVVPLFVSLPVGET